MSRKALLLAVGLLAAVLSIAAVACDDGDDDNGDGNGGVIVDGDVLQLVATLTEEGGSGASGVAELSVNGEGILASLVMEGLSEGVHPNHLHHGSCAEQGEIHITLDNVVADESGDGLQTTANDEQPLSHFAEGHYLAVHEAEDDLTVVACGDVVA